MVIDWAEVDDQANVIFGKQMVGLSFGFGLAVQEAGAYILDVGLKVLWDAQHMLVCKFITYLLV